MDNYRNNEILQNTGDVHDPWRPHNCNRQHGLGTTDTPGNYNQYGFQLNHDLAYIRQNAEIPSPDYCNRQHERGIMSTDMPGQSVNRRQGGDRRGRVMQGQRREGQGQAREGRGRTLNMQDEHPDRCMFYGNRDFSISDGRYHVRGPRRIGMFHGNERFTTTRGSYRLLGYCSMQHEGENMGMDRPRQSRNSRSWSGTARPGR